MAFALLAGFYSVTEQAVARSHTHWEQASVARSTVLENCAEVGRQPVLQDCMRLY